MYYVGIKFEIYKHKLVFARKYNENLFIYRTFV